MKKNVLWVAPLLTAGLVALHTFARVTPTPDHRTGRPPELWTYFMHGIVDQFATPVDWKDLFGPNQDMGKYLVTDHPIDTPYKQSNAPAVRLVRSDFIDLARPVPMDLAKVRGQVVRIFLWLRGEDVGARNNCWHAPGLITIIKDAKNNVLAQQDAYFQTQRTFPWHCYYTEVFVPQEAAGVYLRLFGKFNGRAYFASPSWELVTPENTYSVEQKQDPFTGSLAFNPKYDEMPYHLKHGTLEANRYPWRFVLGSKIGLVGQPYDITTKAGFRKYYFEKAKRDGEHMNHGILYMGSMYRTGVEKKFLPDMEAGWLMNFAQVLIDDQDPKTGFWHDGTALSLGLTFHLCNMHFRYRDIPRTDRPDIIKPSMDLGIQKIPRADAIIRTVLRQQSSWIDDKGQRHKAAWNWAAYRYTETPDAFEEKCHLGSTWDAINLLRCASNYLGPDQKRQVYDSVKAAFDYVLRKCVLDDGIYKQRDTDEYPTGPNYMAHILCDTAWLERRVLADRPGPAVRLDGQTITWLAPKDSQNSVRIYVVPKGINPSRINESLLAGVIHRTGHKIYQMDPFLAVQKIRQATCRRWGGSMDLPAPGTWQGEQYLPWKLRQIHYPLPFTNDLKPLTLAIDRPDRKEIYVSAADWYGEESLPVLLQKIK